MKLRSAKRFIQTGSLLGGIMICGETRRDELHGRRGRFLRGRKASCGKPQPWVEERGGAIREDCCRLSGIEGCHERSDAQIRQSRAANAGKAVAGSAPQRLA